MKIYFAGNIPTTNREKELNRKRLYSYFYLRHVRKIAMRVNGLDLFLDSGAFSMWTKGGKIDIQEYIQFIKKYEAMIGVYTNLDVIGDPVQTWRNQKIMEQAGLQPLPVFHTHLTKIEWLKKYIDAGYDYIALGGIVGGDITPARLVRRLDVLFDEYLTDSKGCPIVKVHGFGLTNSKLLFRYPWYSSDSSSWLIARRLGTIIMPRFKNGQWVYGGSSWRVVVSSWSGHMKEAGKQKILSPKQQQLVLDYVQDKGYKLGKSTFKKVSEIYQPKEGERWAEKKTEVKNGKRLLEIIEEEGISNRHLLRGEINIIYFLDLAKAIPEWPRPFKMCDRNRELWV